MAVLTKEYLDEQLKKQTGALRQFAEEQTDALARIIATVAEPMERHFEKLDKELRCVRRGEAALGGYQAHQGSTAPPARRELRGRCR